jgi:chaperonin GroES
MAAVAMKSKIQPLHDRALVKPLADEQITASGLVLPDTAKEKPQRGVVLAVGPGRVTDDGNVVPMRVEPGQTIIFAKFSGSEIREDDEDLLMIAERDILAIHDV